jgi:hypothetical protein
MSGLDLFRRRLDKLDDQIARLLGERFAALEVAVGRLVEAGHGGSVYGRSPTVPLALNRLEPAQRPRDGAAAPPVSSLDTRRQARRGIRRRASRAL